MNPVAAIGRITLGFLGQVGSLTNFTVAAVTHTFRPPFYFGLVLQQMMRIGFYSLPVVGLTAFFTGGVLALQMVLGITRELGPVIAGLMVAGRVAAAIAAELGTMRVTEQIDALTTLATNPFKYLVVPRLVAAVLCMPILVAVADSVGVFGGYVIATQSLNFIGATYIKNTVDFVTYSDVTSGLVKAAFFGFIIALMGAYHGFHSKGGAQGVGAATTNAVVSASILILAANYLLTSILFTK